MVGLGLALERQNNGTTVQEIVPGFAGHNCNQLQVGEPEINRVPRTQPKSGFLAGSRKYTYLCMVHAHIDVCMLCAFIHVDRWVPFQLLLIRGIY